MRHRLVLALAVLSVIAASCGGDGAAAGVASLEGTDSTVAPAEDNRAIEDAADADLEQAMFAFASCMRTNGVEIEDPTVDADGNLQFGGLRTQGGNADREAIRAGMEACEDHLEGVVLGRGGDLDPTELQDTLLEFAVCMRENGYDMPDPDFSNAGPGGGDEPAQGGGPFGRIDFDDPDFVTAQEACQDVLGDIRGPGARFSGGGGAG